MNSTLTHSLITLAAGIFLVSTACGQVPAAPALAPHRAPIARKQPLTTPTSTKRAPASAKGNGGGLTEDDVRQLDQMLQNLTPKERKQFTKALKQLSPEGRKQLVEGMKRQQPGKGTPSHVAAHRVAKAPPPLPRRLAF